MNSNKAFEHLEENETIQFFSNLPLKIIIVINKAFSERQIIYSSTNMKDILTKIRIYLKYNQQHKSETLSIKYASDVLKELRMSRKNIKRLEKCKVKLSPKNTTFHLLKVNN